MRIRDYLGLPTVRWSGESLETLRGYATKASWHKGRRLREGSEVPSWSEGVLTELYRDEVRQLRARETPQSSRIGRAGRPRPYD